MRYRRAYRSEYGILANGERGIGYVLFGPGLDFMERKVNSVIERFSHKDKND